MAIGVNATISSGDLTAQGTNTVTITKPTGTASTDILVAVFAVDLGGTPGTIATPSGWTAIAASVPNSTIRLYGFWSLGSNATLGFGHTQGSFADDVGWVCVGFTGVDNTTPIDATGTTNTSTGSATLVTNAVTVATANAWHCIAVCDWNAGAGEFSASGFTPKQNAATHAISALLYNTTPKSTGSTGTATITSATGASGQLFAGMPFALRPAGGAAFLPNPRFPARQSVHRSNTY